MAILMHVSTPPLRKHRLSNMSFDFVSLVPAGDNPEAFVVISKADPANKEDDMGDQISKDGLDPEVVAYIDGLESEVDDLSKSVVDLEDEKTGLEKSLKDAQDSGLIVKSEEEQHKALLEKADPAIRVLLEKQAADLKTQQDIAKAERDIRLDREFISKAEGMPMIGEDKTALGSLLRRISDALTPEDTAEVEKILKSANEQIAQGNLFTEYGHGGGETTVSKSVEAAASQIQTAQPGLTHEQAIAKAYETNPALLAEAMNAGQEG